MSAWILALASLTAWVGDLVPRAAPPRIRAAGLDLYKRLALGNDHTCGERADGTLRTDQQTCALAVLFLVSIPRGTGPGSMLAS
jgi:hypothetical protein